ncbi:MAG: hypothetical protein AB4042_12885 [Leptolyngbyaceae cyanobacterium]
MKTSIQSPTPTNEVYERLVSAMTKMDRSNFTQEQLYVLRQACQKLAPRKHAVDVRLSVPMPHTPGFYCVFLAGSERRNEQRTAQERRVFWRLTYLLLGSLGLAGVLMLRMPMMASHLSYLAKPASDPTALPWISSEEDCSGSDRVWEDNACWDSQHDPTF